MLATLVQFRSGLRRCQESDDGPGCKSGCEPQDFPTGIVLHGNFIVFPLYIAKYLSYAACMRLVMLFGLIALGGCCCRFDMTSGPTSELVGAARSGSVEKIRSLVKEGADPNATSGVNGWTVLMHAIHKNQLRAVEELVAAGANPNAVIGRGTSPLSMAAGYGQTEIVDALLQGGADPHVPLRDGLVALDFAISGVGDIDDWTAGKCQTATVRRLIDAAPELVTPEMMERTKSMQDKCPEVQQLLTSAASGKQSQNQALAR